MNTKIKLISNHVYLNASSEYGYSGGGYDFIHPRTGKRNIAGGALCAIVKGREYHGLTEKQIIAEAMKINNLTRSEIVEE